MPTAASDLTQRRDCTFGVGIGFRVWGFRVLGLLGFRVQGSRVLGFGV